MLLLILSSKVALTLAKFAANTAAPVTKTAHFGDATAQREPIPIMISMDMTHLGLVQYLLLHHQNVQPLSLSQPYLQETLPITTKWVSRFSEYLMNIICCLLKSTSFWHSANEKLISNYLVHAIARQCMFTLSRCILQSLRSC